MNNIHLKRLEKIGVVGSNFVLHFVLHFAQKRLKIPQKT